MAALFVQDLGSSEAQLAAMQAYYTNAAHPWLPRPCSNGDGQPSAAPPQPASSIPNPPSAVKIFVQESALKRMFEEVGSAASNPVDQTLTFEGLTPRILTLVITGKWDELWIGHKGYFMHKSTILRRSVQALSLIHI